MYEALRLCPDGGGGTLVDGGQWRDAGSGVQLFHYRRYNGSAFVVNTSGGLETKGHPIGATGLAQCAELCWQLRGVAGPRQLSGARIGLQHNYGWASAAVVTIYQRLAVGGSEKAKL